ncbi:MAG: pentapeptide repeat-containing protein [Bdellovibrionaceae bacterium]|nr:pentapeptide repeat-containing protein [Pseudobdellovibrionaceae bacterium]
MRSTRRTDGPRTRIEDVSGDNWDAEAIDLLLHEGESSESVLRPEQVPRVHTEKQNDLSRADLTGAQLNQAHLNGAELVLAQLPHAELRKAHLADAHLSYANLHKADLKDVDLSGADLSFADLSEADLRGAHLVSANLESADLRGADLRDAGLSAASLVRANLVGSIFNERTDLPFDMQAAIELGMVFIASDASPDVEVTSLEDQQDQLEDDALD